MTMNMKDTRVGDTWYRVEEGTLLVCGPSDTEWREAGPDDDEVEVAHDPLCGLEGVSCPDCAEPE